MKRQGDKQQMRSFTWLFGVAAVLIGPAQAGQVYKCTVGGSTVYQDVPCREAGQGKAQVADTGTSDSLMALVRQMRELDAEIGRLHDEVFDKEASVLAQRRAELGLRKDQPMPEAGFVRAKQILAPLLEKIRATEARRESLSEELRRRCPGGATLSATKQDCRQKTGN